MSVATPARRPRSLLPVPWLSRAVELLLAAGLWTTASSDVGSEVPRAMGDHGPRSRVLVDVFLGPLSREDRGVEVLGSAPRVRYRSRFWSLITGSAQLQRFVVGTALFPVRALQVAMAVETPMWCARRSRWFEVDGWSRTTRPRERAERILLGPSTPFASGVPSHHRRSFVAGTSSLLASRLVSVATSRRRWQVDLRKRALAGER